MTISIKAFRAVLMALGFIRADMKPNSGWRHEVWCHTEVDFWIHVDSVDSGKKHYSHEFLIDSTKPIDASEVFVAILEHERESIHESYAIAAIGADW